MEHVHPFLDFIHCIQFPSSPIMLRATTTFLQYLYNGRFWTTHGSWRWLRLPPRELKSQPRPRSPPRICESADIVRLGQGPVDWVIGVPGVEIWRSAVPVRWRFVFG